MASSSDIADPRGLATDKEATMGRTPTVLSDTTIYRPSTAPFSHDLFENIPDMIRVRRMYFKALAGGTVLVSLTILAIFSIYWGALWKTSSHSQRFDSWVVDFDRGIIGTATVDALLTVGNPSTVRWQLRDSSEFGSPSDVAAAVVAQQCWSAITVNPGASALLAQAVMDADPLYNGTLAITAYATEARNENGYRSIIKPNIDVPMQQLAAKFARDHIYQLAQQPNFATLATTAPQILTQPLYYSINNIHPFDVPVATAVTFVGLIYLTILSFVVTMISAGARQASGIERLLRTRSLILLRLASPVAIYLVLTLFYSLLNLGFRLPFNRHFGHRGFLIFWMVQYSGMLSLGLAIESMITILTPRFIPFFVIFWIILNVSVSLLPIEALARLYEYGYAMPFYHISQAVRAIVFGTKNHFGENFGVLIAWIIASCISLPILVWLTHAREVNRRQNASQRTV